MEILCINIDNFTSAPLFAVQSIQQNWSRKNIEQILEILDIQQIVELKFIF